CHVGREQRARLQPHPDPLRGPDGEARLVRRGGEPSSPAADAGGSLRAAARGGLGERGAAPPRGGGTPPGPCARAEEEFRIVRSAGRRAGAAADRAPVAPPREPSGAVSVERGMTRTASWTISAIVHVTLMLGAAILSLKGYGWAGGGGIDGYARKDFHCSIESPELRVAQIQ